MKSVTLHATQYSTWVYPMFGASKSGSDAEFETALRVIRKLKDPSLTVAVPPTEAEKLATRPGVEIFQYRQLREAQATFLFEEDEIALVLRRMLEQKSGVPAVTAEDYLEVVDLLKNAPAYQPAPVEG